MKGLCTRPGELINCFRRANNFLNSANFPTLHTLAAMGHARPKHSGVEAAFHQYLKDT